MCYFKATYASYRNAVNFFSKYTKRKKPKTKGIVDYQDCSIQSNDNYEQPVLSIGIDCEFGIQSESQEWCHNYNLSREQLAMFLATCLTLFSDEDVDWLLAFNQHLGESRKEYNLEEFTKMFNERVEFAEDETPNPVYLNFMKGLY